MPTRLQIDIGAVYCGLTVMAEAPSVRLPSGQINRMIKCRCVCGNETTVRLLHLVRELIKSCGCAAGERHGKAGTPLYRVWRTMHNRCYLKSCECYRNYGGRGISICAEWLHSFIRFQEWSMSNGYEKGLHIDRANNDGNYEPGNCRWVTPLINANNTSTNIQVMYRGEKRGLHLLVHEKGLSSSYGAIVGRIKRGWTADSAIDTPIRSGNYRRCA